MRAERMRSGVGGPAVFLMLAIALSCTPSDQASPTLVVLGGSVFDTETGTFRRNTGILVRDSIIAALEGSPPDRRDTEITVIELQDGQFVIPGFFDLHAHYAVDLLGNGRVDEDRVYPSLFLGNGVTSTFPAGEMNPERMRALRLRIETGEQPGPRLFNSGPYYGSARPGWDAEAITRDSLRAEVAFWAGQGARGFKAKGIGPDHLAWLIEAAHEYGLTVTGHLGSGYRGSVNPRDAIAMGIDRVEHFMGGDGMPASRSAYASLVQLAPDDVDVLEVIDLYVENSVYFNATLSAYGYYGARDPVVYAYFQPEMEWLTPYARAQVEAGLPRPVNDQFEEIYWAKRGLIKAFFDRGGRDLITLGTDHPSWGEYFSGFSVHRELHSMVLSGIPAADALRIATLNGARAMEVEDMLGSITVGKLADLVVLGGDPTIDIRATRSVELVIKNGKVYDPAKLLADVKGTLGPGDESERSLW